MDSRMCSERRSGAPTRVSFVIPHWNKKDLLDYCIPSLREQTFRDFEIIVVENGSTDGSVEHLKGVYPDVRLIELPENLGFAPATNFGIEASNAEFIAFFSNDVVADPEWLERMVAVMDAEPDVGMTGSKLVWADQPDRIYAAGDTYTVGGYPFNVGQNAAADDPAFAHDRDVFSVCTAAALFRREALEGVKEPWGYFDNRYFAHGEDTDLGFRLRLCGWRARYVAGAVARHEGSYSSDPGSPAFIRRTQRNGVMTFVKDYPARLLLRHWHRALMVFALSVFLTPHRKSAVLGRIDALRRLPELLRDRRRIQSRISCDLGELEELMKEHRLTRFF